jgi:Ca2+-binding RTX toxin-like protein
LEDRTLLSADSLGQAVRLLPAVGPNRADDSSLVVRFKTSETVADVLRLLPTGSTAALVNASHPGLWKVQLPTAANVPGAIAAYKANAAVLYAERVQQLSAATAANVLIPNDTSFATQWDMNNTGQSGGTAGADIHATAAWDTSNNALSVIVADIDTGIDYTHPDLYENIWINPGEIPASRRANLTDVDGDGRITFWDLNDPVNQGPGKITDLNGNGYIDGGDLLKAMNQVGGVDAGTGGWADGVDQDGNGYKDDLIGWDFVNNDNDPMDDYGHGTHTSGTIGALGNNNRGVAGVVWKTQLMALKFLDNTGNGNDVGASQAINYSVAKGAMVSSNSWGGTGYSSTLFTAIQNAGAAGQLFVAAAGNSNMNTDVTPYYPAGYNLPNVIAVAATDRTDHRSSFSNYGPASVDLGAPGSSILSAWPNNSYATLNGTSMATPHVSGAAVLLRALHPSWTYSDVKSRLLSTVDPVPDLAGKTVTGGRLDLAAAADISVPDVPGSGIDIRMLQAQTDGLQAVTLTYAITGASVAPFEIGLYRSTDALAGGDTYLGSVTIASAADLAVGTHVKTYTIGGGAGQVALPGFGAPEMDADYFILALADRTRVVAEDDADPFNEDNTVPLTGVYHPAGGDVFVHGTAGGDTITVSPNGASSLDVNVNGPTYTYALADLANLRIRGHAGDDSISGTSISKVLLAWAGAGTDTVSGGTGSDTLDGGPGADLWLINGTALADAMSVQADAVAGRLRSTRGTETDRFVFDSGDSVLVQGGDGNDNLSVLSNVSLPVTLSGGLGNDTLTGGGGPATLQGNDGNDILTGGTAADVLQGGDGNDTLNGKLGDDVIDGGLGTDSWTFEGTANPDYLSLDWDVSQSRLVGQRRASAGGSVLETDVATGIEKFTMLGQNGADTLDLSAMAANDMALSGLVSPTLSGGQGNDTLIGGAGNDNLQGLTENDVLQGGPGNDTLDGGTGDDLLQGGAGNDSLIPNGGNDTVQGGDGNDTITLSATQTAGTNIDGGNNQDTLVAANVANNWDLTGVNAGTVNSMPFVNLENLTGGNTTDLFKVETGANMAGLVNGSPGTNTLDFSAYGGAVTVNNGTKAATGILSYLSIGAVIGSASTADTLVGPNGANTWNITGTNAGSLNGTLSYSGFENLTGGTAGDTFKFNPGAQVTGLLDGQAGTDKLDYSLYGSPVAVNLQARTAPGLTNPFNSIESLAGSAGLDTLIGPDVTNTWLITSTDAGTVGTFSFTSVENLAGGAGADTFKFSNAKGINGSLDGGAGSNTIDDSLYSTGVAVNLNAGSATGVTGTVTNIANVTGGAGNDTLTGNAGDNVLLGNAGDDQISSGTNGNDILVGGVGNDTLTGGADRGLLIGGTGSDQLLAGGADDILVGGSTSYDANTAALAAIMAEWKRTDLAYQQRIDHIRGITAGGLNGTFNLKAATVVDDNTPDTLTGGLGQDWFWARVGQDTFDQAAGEVLN